MDDDVRFVEQLLRGGEASTSQPPNHRQQRRGPGSSQRSGRAGGRGSRSPQRPDRRAGGSGGGGGMHNQEQEARPFGRAMGATGTGGRLRCELCECWVHSAEQGGWDEHVRGIRHRRQLLSVRHFGETGHTVVSAFEVEAGLGPGTALQEAYGGSLVGVRAVGAGAAALGAQVGGGVGGVGVAPGPATAQQHDMLCCVEAACASVSRRLPHYCGVGRELADLQQRYIGRREVSAAVPGMRQQLQEYVATRHAAARGGAAPPSPAAEPAGPLPSPAQQAQQQAQDGVGQAQQAQLEQLQQQPAARGAVDCADVRQLVALLALLELRHNAPLRGLHVRVHFTAGGRLPSLPAAVACLEALADVLAALHAPSLEALHVELAADDAATAHAASSERRLHSSLAQLVLALEQGLLRRVPSLRVLQLIVPHGASDALRQDRLQQAAAAAAGPVRNAVLAGSSHERMGGPLHLLPQPLVKQVLDLAAPLQPCAVRVSGS